MGGLDRVSGEPLEGVSEIHWHDRGLQIQTCMNVETPMEPAEVPFDGNGSPQ